MTTTRLLLCCSRSPAGRARLRLRLRRRRRGRARHATPARPRSSATRPTRRSADDRLQELHRAARARRDLRPGAARRGYDVKTKLDLGDETWRGRRSKSGEIDAYPDTWAPRCCRSSASSPTTLPEGPQRPTSRSSRTSRSAGWSRSRRRRSPPPTRSRSPRRPRTGSLTKISDLEGHVEAHAGRLARVPRAARLPARAGDGLRPEVRPLHRPPDPPAPRGTHLGESRRSHRVHHRSADPAESRGAAGGRRSMFRPYNSTLVMRKETADAAGPTFRDPGPDPGRAHRREHAGAERESRSGRAGARRRRQGLPDGERPDRRRLKQAPSRSGRR